MRRCPVSFCAAILLLAAGLALAATGRDGRTVVVRPKAQDAHRWALLVGIDDYESPDISKLSFAVADAKALAQALTQRCGYPEEQVKLMTSESPLGSLDRPSDVNVIQRLDYLAKKIGPDDTFVFGFSGHGFQRGEEDHFLGTVNAQPASLETLQRSSLPLKLLQEKMKKIQARRVIFLIDACRNDPEKGRGEGDNKRTQAFARDLEVVAASAASGLAGSAVFFACSDGERAYEWPEKGHGVFSYYLLQGLAGSAVDANGEVAMANLGDYVQKQVLRWGEERGKTQRPDLRQQGAARILLAEGLALAPMPPQPPNPGGSQAPPPEVITPGPVVPPQPPNPGGSQPGQAWVNPQDQMEFVYVPAGPFTMGSNDGLDNEKPQHRVTLPGYWIGKTEVTNEQYARFLNANGGKTQDDQGRVLVSTQPVQVGNRTMQLELEQAGGQWRATPGYGKHPVVMVTWYGAMAYCKWAGARLPTEAEWEKAARGPDGRTYPWGSEWDPAKANTDEGGPKKTTAVGSYPEGASLYGCLDMTGNVWEWTSSRYAPYPYDATDGREDPNDNSPRVYRGGCWSYLRDDARAAFRFDDTPGNRYDNLGFRCARSSTE